ncbi:uncharacterized protein B0I36DRAFT_316991 [Microdochium trichocladiopsis]|uniref:F-box domain-containing protein n=1 Tax=Microdochium trichocladiopsis TaxID=1682393 RepID=A0A9P8YD82_9PEZI|nr:uncharacterized protein B0I36DRAFT_316991 [Microdochium trichocladiopsis]KAH7034811.1 hypothetical protein B0I36DRAFT_316991 [Microdochium trichocladiopsis]
MPREKKKKSRSPLSWTNRVSYLPQDLLGKLESCHKEHSPGRWQTFVIPQTLLINPAYSRHTSPLLRLPLELSFLILGHLDPISAVCLATSCKYMLHAALSTGEPLMIPSARHHRGVTPRHCEALYRLMRLMWPVVKRTRAPAKRDRTVMLCSTCWRYRPRLDDEYWSQTRQKLLEEVGVSCRHVERISDLWRSGSITEWPGCFYDSCSRV